MANKKRNKKHSRKEEPAKKEAAPADKKEAAPADGEKKEGEAAGGAFDSESKKLKGELNLYKNQ